VSGFAGRVIAITGASQGIGAELARQLAAPGVRLALCARGVDVTIVYPGVVATEIRRSGYGADGRPAGVSGLDESGAMPVGECARQIIAAMAARRRELVMGARGRIGLWLKMVAPGLVDRMAAAALRRDAGGR